MCDRPTRSDRESIDRLPVEPTLLENDFPDLPVLSYRELVPELGIDTVGRVTVGGTP